MESFGWPHVANCGDDFSPGIRYYIDPSFGPLHSRENSITTRSALTTIEIIEKEDLVENARVVGLHALERLNEMKERHPVIGNMTG